MKNVTQSAIKIAKTALIIGLISFVAPRVFGITDLWVVAVTAAVLIFTALGAPHWKKQQGMWD